MPRTGLEPARLAALAPETSASTIPPPGLVCKGKVNEKKLMGQGEEPSGGCWRVGELEGNASLKRGIHRQTLLLGGGGIGGCRGFAEEAVDDEGDGSVAGYVAGGAETVHGDIESYHQGTVVF